MSNDKFVWDDDKVKELLRKTTSYVSDEHWSGVVEQFKREQLSKRDWEIVKWRDVDSGGIYETKVYNRNTEIHSVRRLSDGEVFSVGDKIADMYGDDIIDAFWLDYHGNSLWVSTNQKKKYGCSLDVAEKAKKKVLLTDDNVWLAYDDVVWWVAVKEEEGVYCGDDLFDFGKSLVNERMFPKTKNYKYFSTEASTLDYILMNKPMLSVNDVVIMNNAKFPSTTNIEFWISLKQLAKSKMNGKK